MGRIEIERGLTRDDVFDQYGEQIGVAVYDLDDAQVRINIIHMADKVDALMAECNAKAEALSANEADTTSDSLAVGVLYGYVADEMIKMVDAAIGEGFSARAIGANNRNPYDLWAVVEAVGKSYGVKTKAKMDKGVNRAIRRAQQK